MWLFSGQLCLPSALAFVLTGTRPHNRCSALLFKFFRRTSICTSSVSTDCVCPLSRESGAQKMVRFSHLCTTTSCFRFPHLSKFSFECEICGSLMSRSHRSSWRQVILLSSSQAHHNPFHFVCFQHGLINHLMLKLSRVHSPAASTVSSD